MSNFVFSCRRDFQRRVFACVLHDGVHELRRLFDDREMERMFYKPDPTSTREDNIKAYYQRVEAFAEAQMRAEWDKLALKGAKP